MEKEDITEELNFISSINSIMEQAYNSRRRHYL